MCDYSLMMLQNRIAEEGEELVAHRFCSGTTGLVSRAEFSDWQARRAVPFWHKLKDCLWSPREPAQVVCIPPGARLRLKNLPRNLRDQFGLESREDVTFTQVSAQEDRHRDALLFANGTTMMLQWLPEGQAATVLRLSSAEEISHDPELVRAV